jgi:hypothetical protein
MFTTISTGSETTQRLMAVKLTGLSHKIAIQLHLVAESCTTCSSRSRRPVRKLLDTPSYVQKHNKFLCLGKVSFRKWISEHRAALEEKHRHKSLKSSSSVLWHGVALWWDTNVSEDLAASIFTLKMEAVRSSETLVYHVVGLISQRYV